MIFQYVFDGFSRTEPKDWLLLVIPLCITGAGFLVTLSFRVTKNHFLARRFRLTGSFITFYGDPVKSNGLDRVYAESTLRQRGTTIEITTKETNGRTWVQHGYIVKDRFISGWYQSKDPHDTGVGTFFLEIKNADTLLGTWHGFDHKNNKLISIGDYEFYRKGRIKIAAMTTSQISRVLQISDECFGSRYLTGTALKQAGTHVSVACIEAKVVGFSLVKRLDASRLVDIIPKEQIIGGSLEYADTMGNVGLLRTIAVDKNYRNSGIGRSLFLSAEDYLFQHDATAIVVPIWHWNDTDSLENIAKLNGYNFLYEHAEYWKDECDAGQFYCTAKSSNKCVCSCRFYYRTYHRDTVTASSFGIAAHHMAKLRSYFSSTRARSP